MKQNWLDKAVAFVAPGAGLRRWRMRAALTMLGSSMSYYNGAAPSHRNASRRYIGGDANAPMRSGRERLMQSARDLERNTPLGVRIGSALKTEVIGAGIIPSITGVRGKAMKAQGEALLKAHCDTPLIDVAGKTDLYGLQGLAFRAAVRDGEALMVRRRAMASEKLPLPFQIVVLEAEYLDQQIDGDLKGGNFAVQGVEFNRTGKVVAYHLFDHHPGDSTLFGYPISKRHLSDDVVHLFRVDRAGQARGVSWFAPVIVELADLHEYHDAQLVRQKVAALFTAFRKKSGFAGDAEDDGNGEISAAGMQLTTLEPGLIQDLGSDEDIEFSNPPTVGDFEPFTRVRWRNIALGMGMSYEALTGDLSQVNFASGRMGHLFFQRNIDAWRQEMVLPQMCWKVGQWLLEGLALSMRLPQGAGIGWTPPRREMIDPGKELKAAAFAAEKGLGTNSQFLRSIGFDPEDVEDERADELARYVAKGLIAPVEPDSAKSVNKPKSEQEDTSNG